MYEKQKFIIITTAKHDGVRSEKRRSETKQVSMYGRSHHDDDDTMTTTTRRRRWHDDDTTTMARRRQQHGAAESIDSSSRGLLFGSIEQAQRLPGICSQFRKSQEFKMIHHRSIRWRRKTSCLTPWGGVQSGSRSHIASLTSQLSWSLETQFQK